MFWWHVFSIWPIFGTLPLDLIRESRNRNVFVPKWWPRPRPILNMYLLTKSSFLIFISWRQMDGLRRILEGDWTDFK